MRMNAGGSCAAQCQQLQVEFCSSAGRAPPETSQVCDSPSRRSRIECASPQPAGGILAARSYHREALAE
eukprot:scaffold51439_cov14-Tisochrysis_lutea.AAC.2